MCSLLMGGLGVSFTELAGSHRPCDTATRFLTAMDTAHCVHRAGENIPTSCLRLGPLLSCGATFWQTKAGEQPGAGAVPLRRRASNARKPSTPQGTRSMPGGQNVPGARPGHRARRRARQNPQTPLDTLEPCPARWR